jgi:hypothetical protein
LSQGLRARSLAFDAAQPVDPAALGQFLQQDPSVTHAVALARALLAPV